MTVEFALDHFDCDEITARQRQFDGPIVIIDYDQGRGLWAAPYVHFPCTEIDVMCIHCRNTYTITMQTRELEYFKQSGLVYSLGQSQRQLLIEKLCSGCHRKVVLTHELQSLSHK